MQCSFTTEHICWLLFTLGWIASFWLTSWDLRMRTSSLRTSSSSLTEVSWSRRTLYAGAPGAVTSGDRVSVRAFCSSFNSFFSFLFSDSSSWRCNKQGQSHHPQHGKNWVTATISPVPSLLMTVNSMPERISLIGLPFVSSAKSELIYMNHTNLKEKQLLFSPYSSFNSNNKVKLPTNSGQQAKKILHHSALLGNTFIFSDLKYA